MLSRVADSLFWMSRYIERAENTVRLVDVNHQTLLESEHSNELAGYKHWEPTLLALGELALFESIYDRKTSYNVTDFLTFSLRNPSSVLSCIAAARENARSIRDQISTEMWETLNKLYLFIKNTRAEAICSEVNFEFFARIKDFCHLLRGVIESTFPREIGYEYIVCGREIERADKTCRILDTKRFMPTKSDAVEDALDSAQYAAILRSCTALEAFSQEYGSDLDAIPVRSFLLLSRRFPRSVLFCIQAFQGSMHTISGCPLTEFSNEAERLTGRLVSKLKYAGAEDIEGTACDELIDEIEETLLRIAAEFSRKYMGAEFWDPVSTLEESSE